MIESPALLPEPGSIQIWSDLLCPFAYVAIHRLTRVRDEQGLRGEVHIDHRCFPLELFNGPHSRPGTDSEAVGLGQIEPAAEFRLWTAAEWDYPSTVLLAAESVQAAKEQGLDASADLDLALRRAFWTSSRSIGHRNVILEVAETVEGLDQRALTEALDSGRHRRDIINDYEISKSNRIKGSPHLFTVDGYDVNNPGISVHWDGPWASGFPVVDADDDAWVAEVLARVAPVRTS